MDRNKNKPNNFDFQVNKKLEKLQPQIPAGLWEKIELELDTREKPVRINFARISAIAAVLMLFALALVWYKDSGEETIYLQKKAMNTAAAVTNKQHDEAIKADAIQVEDNTTVSLPNESRLLSQIPTLDTISKSDILLAKSTSHFTATIVEKASMTALSLDSRKLENNNTNAIHNDLASHFAKQNTKIEHSKTNKIESLGFSTILNLVVAQVDKRQEKIVSFSDDEEGNLKIDFNLALR